MGFPGELQFWHVHADASSFSQNATKQEVYEQVLESSIALFEGQRNWVANLANAASLLWHGFHSLPSPSNKVNWAGFYVLDPNTSNQLILGPFQGKVACQTIRFGKGVCGQTALQAETGLVKDVHTHPDHIACDSQTKSEIVVPIIADGKVVGVIDIDCEELEGFDEEDRKYLEQYAALLAKSCNW
ncbi:GAF domain-like protein [Protomyces lactucae-debilis]|uniref:GAF domain-like protein n=1 Tax=Protomyces lactucae-debilis TaxID=2754530 RepID=A0A1Y2ER76_PROLT|nr:GAF domain-like protein [Protomyces lactucae-debilis]ORY73686.1 GAF domain-like protein [Protomyces lactucae-debilis]